MTGALIILGVLVLTGLVLYLFHRRDVRRGRALAPTRGPMQDVPEGEDSVCCGMHSTCEKDSLLASVSDKIEYFDDDGKLTYNNEVGYAFACYEYDNLEMGKRRLLFTTMMNQEI